VPKIDGRKLSHQALEHMRVLAVRRVIEDGERPREVIDSLGLCRTSIYPWLRRYRDQGLEALAEKISQGPEPKLSDKQRPQVRRWILGKDPRQHGFDFGLWTRRIVQTLILEKMGVEFCLTSVGKLLASLEITPQKPLRRAYERDPVAVERWLRIPMKADTCSNPYRTPFRACRTVVGAKRRSEGGINGCPTGVKVLPSVLC
jgi:transposase